MTTALYVNRHTSQGGEGQSYVTRVYGCTWTSLANGIDGTTGGRHRPSPDYLHGLVPRDQETDPSTRGWSIPDAVKAASRYGITLVDRSGKGWGDLTDQLDEEHYVLLQGDSDQFASDTCSGAFDGPHCIGIHPRARVVSGIRYRWIDDPICPQGRWAPEGSLRRYGEKLGGAGLRFAAFAGRVPTITIPAPSTTGDDMATAIRTEARQIASDSVVRVRAGTKVYRDATGKTPIRTIAESVLLDDFGVPTGATGWRAVRLVAGQFDKDPDAEGGIGLVKDSDITGGPRPKTDDELAATAARFR